MIIYYDLLWVDDTSLLGENQSERFRQLESIITIRKGHAELVKRHIIDFRRKDARKRLQEAFAKCIIARGEGLVLKPDDPYFDFSHRSRRYASCAIKLKKEYLKGFGDVGDFAIIGASYNAPTAKKSKVLNLKYTHFFVACLENLKEAQARTARPRFVVTNIVTLNDTQLEYFKRYCNPAAVPLNASMYSDLDFQGLGNSYRPTDIFPEPPIFDIYCFSFDKAPNSRMWTMRFPQVSKIQSDRSWTDILSFEKFQDIARGATEAPEMEDSQEMRLWLSKIEKSEPKKNCLDYESQATVSTASTVSTVSTVPGSSTTTLDQPTADNDALDYVRSQAVLADMQASATSQGDPVTHPGSPAANKTNAAGADLSSTAPRIRSGGQKRASLSVAGSSPIKRAKTQSANRSKQPSQDGSATSKKRRPLDSRDANNSQMTTGSLSSISLSQKTEDLKTTPSTACHTPDHGKAVFSTTNELLSTSPSFGIPILRVVHSCGHTRRKTACAFINSTFLLAPCISQYAWVQDLLKGHGVLDFTVDPATWAAYSSTAPSSVASTPRSGSPASRSTRSSPPSRTKKICLVEVRRPEATINYMRKIEAANLRCRNGEREWVSVYDWRILEDITKMESGVSGKGLDPWRTRYVGLA